MATIQRRRSRRDSEEEEREERPTRGRRSRDDDEGQDEGRPTRSRRGSASRSDEDAGDERPSRSRRRSSRDDEGDSDEEDRPRRGTRGSQRRGSSGFAAYRQKKRSGGGFTEEFKPWDKDNHAWLIKIGEDGPFDSYNQHYIRDMPDGERRSFVCFDDEYFSDDKHYKDGCPLCEIGESARTYTLFNIINLDNPNKPVHQVWSTPPSVADELERMSEEKKTQPLNREDLYFEVVAKKSKKKVTYTVTPVKARDLPEDYNVEPLEADELEEFEKNFYTDRSAITKVDSWEDLDDLAESLLD